MQRASVVAWNDERHVEETRARYRAKRDVLIPALEAEGLGDRRERGDDVPLGRSAPRRRRRCSSAASSSRPARCFGPSGEGYIRFALVPTLEECERAAAILEEPVTTEETIAALDRGEIRVAEKVDGEWRVNEDAKAAILDYFRIRKVEPIEVGPYEYLDKIPLKRDYAELGVRVVPPATARYGSFLSPGVVMMPSYVNIGAWVGPNTMVDTWATVGSCAQIGADVHLAGGVGIGGVLEPVQARPVIVEDGAFIGSRCILIEGVLVGERAVLAPNVSLTGSVPVIDVTGPEPVEHRGYVPPNAVVVPGTRPKEFPAGTYKLSCALIIGWRSAQTDLKTSLNDVLREYEIGRLGGCRTARSPPPSPDATRAARGRGGKPPPRLVADTAPTSRVAPFRRTGERRAAAVEPHAQVAAREVHEHVALAVRRRRDRHRARPGRRRLPHAALPHARGHLAGPVDAHDLDVRPVRKARMRLEQRPDELDVVGVADDDRVRVADVDDGDVEARDALARDHLHLADLRLVQPARRRAARRRRAGRRGRAPRRVPSAPSATRRRCASRCRTSPRASRRG